MARDDLEEWADAYFQGILGLSKRKTFSSPSYYKGKKMFAFLFEDALGIKTDPQEVASAIEAEPHTYRHFTPGGNVIMKNWLLIARPEARDYEQEIPRIEAAFARMP